MKKTITMFLCVSMFMLTATACGPAGPSGTASPQASAVGTSGEKTGLGVVTSIGKSTDAAEEPGLAEADSTAVALTLDQNGTITQCVIDSIQPKINFSAKGVITTPLDTAFKTKQELKNDYGLGAVSTIKKNWYEQADAFAAYVIGKTVDQVKGIAVDNEGVPTGTDLKTSVTIGVGDFIKAIEKAAAGAKDLGAQKGDKLGLGMKTGIGKSTPAGDNDGNAEADTTYAVTTVDGNGKITSCIIDSSPTKIAFSKEGKITSDLNAEQKTKNELGDNYGLKKASGIGKEWYEQAAALAKYVTGKTADQVNGIALNEEGAATASDLTSSVTISIADAIEVIDKSVKNAR